ncbi:MAG TPA: M14 family metallopeptidase [Candidatus Krumholzibacteria bacterium]|nr:M14 family metallopeptidase [Candidatus Krumholzibacteria bacterium]HRX51258.1 M14 family metallopeptidase [Candidatus Krumholzibacteria bacterium]
MTRRRDVGDWGRVKVPPGERAEVRVVVSESYSGADISIPVHVWRGAEPGPTLLVTAAVHGDEINGTGIIRSIIVDKPFKLRAGALIMVPVVNVMGFERHERYLPDRRDLNRCFPGSARGSLASRLAHVLHDQIISRADYAIDLHTAALRRTNFPNVRADMSKPVLAEFARAFGTELIVSSAGPAGSLRKSATAAGCPSIILEAGEVWKVEPSVVEYGIRGIVNCLRYLRMVNGEPVAPPYRVETDATTWVRAQHGGFLRFHVTPGDLVGKGDPLASNISLTGKRLNVVKAPRTGVVLGMTTLPSVAPGDPICHLAFPRRGELKRMERAVERMDDDELHERVREHLAGGVFVRRKL